MPMENITVNEEEIFADIIERGREEGIVEKDAYNDFVEYIVMEKLEVGEEDKDDDIDGIMNHLKARYEEYREIAGLE